MTTIAYRDGVLAVDSRAMIGGWKSHYEVAKMWRLPDDSVVAGCGELARVVAFKDWLALDDETKAAPDLTDTTLIRLMPDWSIVIYESGGSFHVSTDYAAWGSGAPPALGAMHMGADADRAVEIAALVDDQTGGKVVSMKV